MRRSGDHLPWTRGEHDTFAEGLQRELRELRQEQVKTRIQLTLVLGGVAVIAFLTPLVITVALFLASQGRLTPGG